MLIKVIVVGKLKDKSIQARCDEFAKWLGPYAKIDIRILPDSTVEKEGVAIRKELEHDRNRFLVVLSEEGKEFSSVEFAEKLKRLDRKIVFVIGGPFGLSPEVKEQADLLWSLSRLTFTHELARLLLWEQLYRAVNLIHGGSYHNV